MKQITEIYSVDKCIFYLDKLDVSDRNATYIFKNKRYSLKVSQYNIKVFRLRTVTIQ